MNLDAFQNSSLFNDVDEHLELLSIKQAIALGTYTPDLSRLADVLIQQNIELQDDPEDRS
jgi:anti-sigma28 factor (negative regulator of flagellin synthesis)